MDVEGESSIEFGLSIEPDTFEPLVIQIVNDRDYPGPIRIALGNSKDAAEVGHAILKVAAQAIALWDDLEMADPKSYDEAAKIVQEFGLRVNADYN